MQMTLTTDDTQPRHGPPRGARHDLGPARAAQRRAGVRGPAARPPQAARSGWSAAASGASPSTARASPPTPGSRSRSRTGTSTTTPRRGARRRPARSTSGCASWPTRPAARRCKDDLPTVATAPLETVTVLTPKTPDTEPLPADVGRAGGRGDGQALRRRHARHRRRRPPRDGVLRGRRRRDRRTSPTRSSQDPYMLLGVSDGGAHTKFFTAGRYPTETLAQHVREHELLSLEEAHWRLSALPASLAGFHDRGTAARGRAGRHRRLRLRAPRRAAERGRPRPARRRVAPHPAAPTATAGCSSTARSPSTTTRRPATHSGRLLRHGRG